MTFKPATWFSITVVLAVVNMVAAGFTAGGLHAASHAALAVGFAVLAQHLRQRLRAPGLPAGLEELELEVTELRQELSEAQERLDFTERILSQQQPTEARRLDPER